MSVSHKGKILLSTPDVSGDIFSRSVVLLVEHSTEGAFGLILNKKNQSLSESISALFGVPLVVFDGGPVEIDKIFFIIKGVPFNEYTLPIDADHYITEDSETVLKLVLSEELSIDDFRIFSGYSGWGKQQLESEIDKKYWHVLEIDRLRYTEVDDSVLWKKIMENLGGEFLLWANAPVDISMN